MHILLTDETNTHEAREAVFFIYGGLIINKSTAKQFHRNIREIREEAYFSTSDSFKHSPNSRPEHVTVERFNNAKEKVINACLEHDCKFIAYLIHKFIVKSMSDGDLYSRATSSVFGCQQALKTVHRSALQNRPLEVGKSRCHSSCKTHGGGNGKLPEDGTKRANKGTIGTQVELPEDTKRDRCAP